MTTNERVTQSLSSAVNCYFNANEVAKSMTREHRTLQQSFTRVCVEWLKALAAQEYYDDRNAASVKLAQNLMDIPEVKDLLDESRLPMI